MSIKKLFDEGTSLKVLPSADSQTIFEEIESPETIRQKNIDRETFIPPIEFVSASSFARFGSAEKYWKYAIERVYKQYPYDGSEAEVTEFRNKSDYYDRFIFDYKYPRTTGHVIFSADPDGWGTQQNEASGYGLSDSPQYIYIKGGPGTGSSEIVSGSLYAAFTGSANEYNDDIYSFAGQLAAGRKGTRGSNLRTNLTGGVTVEFWLKKNAFMTAIDDNSTTTNEVLFDLWNYQGDTSADSYGRFRIELSGNVTGSTESPFFVTIKSGSHGFSNLQIGENISKSTVATGEWNHYAFVLYNSSSTATDGIVTELYLNGEKNQTITTAGSRPDVNEITGALVATIGALVAPHESISSTDRGWGQLSASIDDFRFWKVRRTPQEIKKNWWTNVRGGANNDLANTTLGVYYKFNEGITGTSSVDSNILDYAGRVTNGDFVGYTSSSRLTSSAINDYTGSSLSPEFKDPIVYSFHPDVKNLKSDLMHTGSFYDQQNYNSLINMIPTWIIEEDERTGGGDLRNIVQIMASYMDKLYLQIQSLPRLQNTTYLSASYKPYPFASHLLESRGFGAPEIFVDAKIREKILSKTDDDEFDIKLHDIKNLIYQNIYNNLLYIYKTKGSEKSIRNLIRCYGIPEDLITLNLYADDYTYALEDNYKDGIIRKSYANFAQTGSDGFDAFGATVYQYPDSTLDDAESTSGFLSGSSLSGSNEGHADFLGFTVECECIFARKPESKNPGYFYTPFVSSSLFGMHTANSSDDTSLTWGDAQGNDFANFQVYAVRDTIESRHAFFVLTSSAWDTGTTTADTGNAGGYGPIPPLTSSGYFDVYDDSKWNFTIRITPSSSLKLDDLPEYSPLGAVSGASDAIAGAGTTETDYVVDFFAYNAVGEVIQNEFSASTTILPGAGRDFIRSAKRMYLGSHRTNFNGAVKQYSDAKVSSLRVWHTALTKQEIKAHAMDPMNVGVRGPYESGYGLQKSITGSFIPRMDTLALHWNFNKVTGSDDSGQFTVLDMSSGSVSKKDRYRKEWLGKMAHNKHHGRGDKFPTGNSKVIEKRYVQQSQLRLPEVMQSADMVQIVDVNKEIFTRDHKPVRFYFAAEKSMYQTISKEMLTMFASIKDFSNLFCEPVEKYRDRYKKLEKLRQLFFDKVDNEPDLDRYIEFYKWVDASLSAMILQLVPASTLYSKNIRNLVESHILERNKYKHKFPNIDTVHSTEGSIKGVEEQAYSWRYGHRPVSGEESDNARWWRERAERTGEKPSSGVTAVDEARDTIRERVHESNRPKPITPTTVGPYQHKESDATIKLRKSDGTKYEQSRYTRRALNRTYRFVPEQDPSMGSVYQGYTDHLNKRRSYVFSQVYPHGPVTSLGVPVNVLLAFAEKLKKFQDISDEETPKELVKRKYSFQVRSGRHWESTKDPYLDNVKGHLIMPVNVISASSNVTTGYQKNVAEGFISGAIITNIHHDVYGDITPGESALQGPFTEKYVGGHQSRHVDVNKYDTTLVTSGGAGTLNNLDDPYTRPEAWRLFLYKLSSSIASGVTTTDCYDDQGALGFVGPDYPWANEHKYPLIETKRAVYFREPLAKRPVNIRNIQQKTGSTIIGNYTENHEVVQAAGRLENNLYFKENSGVRLPDLLHSNSLGKTTNVHTLVAVGIDDNPDNKLGNSFGGPPGSNVSLRVNAQGNSIATMYTLSERGILGPDVNARNRTVIASRFSAPGGPEVSTRGYLDIASEEYSVYNSINFRNLSVRASASGENTTIKMSNHLSGTAASARAQRDGLRSLLSRRSGQFGHDPEYGSVTANEYVQIPAFHKIQRNTLKRIELSGQGTTFKGASGDDNDPQQSYITASVYDNWWIQHPIPQSDLGYAWITASIADNPRFFGHAPVAGTISSSADGLVSALNFVSASDFGSYYVSNGLRFVTDFGENHADGDLRTAFAPLNTNIREPVTASDNMLGYPLTKDVGRYINIGNEDGPLVPADTLKPGGGLVKRYSAVGQASTLNALLLHRNGPYGYPTFKQIRTGEHPIALYHRRNNNITTLKPGKIIRTTEVGEHKVKVSKTEGIRVFLSGTQAVSMKYHPMSIAINVATPEIGAKTNHGAMWSSKTFTMRVTHGNNIAGYDDKELAIKYLPISPTRQAYDEIKELYLNRTQAAAANTVQSFSMLRYKETVWPSGLNMFMARNRGRTDYQNNFWRYTQADRETLGSSIPIVMGPLVTGSSWPLEEAPRVFSAAAIGATVFITASGDGSKTVRDTDVKIHHEDDLSVPNSYYGGGELVGLYSQIHAVDDDADPDKFILAGPQYSRFMTTCISGSLTSTAGIKNASNGRVLLGLSDNKVTAGIAKNLYGDSFGAANADIRKIHVPLGVTKWEANSLAGCWAQTASAETNSKTGRDNTVTSLHFVSQAVDPWYKDYDSYILDLRAQYKDYSVIPEFRISEHMDFYLDSAQGNFRVDNSALFEIPGTPNTSNSIPQNSSQENFYTIFSNSDVMKYLGLVVSDHTEMVDPSEISLTMKAAVKFMPYDNFYPAQYSVKMANEYSASHLAGASVTGEHSTNKKAAVRPLWQWSFAPGIFYNTVKAGVACDYPIWTSPDRFIRQQVPQTDYHAWTVAANFSWNSGDGFGTDKQTGLAKEKGVFDERIPFEAIIKPHNHLLGTPLYDNEPHVSASLHVTAAFGMQHKPQYSLMASQFWAELPNFFLRDRTYTKMTSKANSDLNLSLQKNEVYGMRVIMFNETKKDRAWHLEPFIGVTAGTASERGGIKYDLPQHGIATVASTNGIELLTMYSRPSAFGPPMHGTDGSALASFEAEHQVGGYDFVNGIYSPYTPPYYDGHAWADIVFYAKESKSYTLEDIINSASVNYMRFDEGEDGVTWSGTYDENDYAYIISGSNPNAPLNGVNINKNSMQISSSMNLFGVEKVPVVSSVDYTDPKNPNNIVTRESLSSAWTMQMKAETPILNFGIFGARPIKAASGTLTRPSNQLSASCTRGMWHQFGTIPENQDMGIKVRISDIPTNFLKYSPRAAAANGFYTKNQTAGQAAKIYKNMKSLADLVGFKKESTRLGEVLEKSVVREAVVAVPFIQAGGKRKFFEIPRAQIEAPTDGTSIASMVEKMEKYVFPPNMNFVKYEDVTPFAMYIFEFEYKLDQCDLSYIWQNLPPRNHTVVKSAEAAISHKLLANELRLGTEASVISDKVQWMVFKVKQKAVQKYEDQIVAINASQNDFTRSNLNTNKDKQGNSLLEKDIDYTYNWPYDYFSIVEMAKLEVEVELSAHEETVPEDIQIDSSSTDKPRIRGPKKVRRRRDKKRKANSASGVQLQAVTTIQGSNK